MLLALFVIFVQMAMENVRSVCLSFKKSGFILTTNVEF